MCWHLLHLFHIFSNARGGFQTGGASECGFTTISVKPESEDGCGGNQGPNLVLPRLYAMSRRSSVPLLFQGTQSLPPLSPAERNCKRHCKEPWDRPDQRKARAEPTLERALAGPLETVRPHPDTAPAHHPDANRDASR